MTCGQYGSASDGAALGADQEDADAFESYLHGGEARSRGMTVKMEAISKRKKRFLEGQGMVEGRDFVVSSTNGKIYSAN